MQFNVFAADVPLFRRVMSDVLRPIATKLSHTLSSECNLKNWVRNFSHSFLKLKPKTWKFGPDSGQLPNLTANNYGMEQDIVNEKSALKTTDTPLGVCNLVYFGPLTKKLFTVFTQPIFHYSNDRIWQSKGRCPNQILSLLGNDDSLLTIPQSHNSSKNDAQRGGHQCWQCNGREFSHLVFL